MLASLTLWSVVRLLISTVIIWTGMCWTRLAREMDGSKEGSAKNESKWKWHIITQSHIFFLCQWTASGVQMLNSTTVTETPCDIMQSKHHHKLKPQKLDSTVVDFKYSKVHKGSFYCRLYFKHTYFTLKWICILIAFTAIVFIVFCSVDVNVIVCNICGSVVGTGFQHQITWKMSLK